MDRIQPFRAGIRWLRHEVFSLVAQYPTLFLPLIRTLIRIGLQQGESVGKHTEIVIEGSPRCGNTFAFVAFELAQPRRVSIAHHLHAAAQVIYAARRNIPTLVLIRRPEEAVLSDVIRSPHRSIRQSLRDYVRFYRRIAPYRTRFVSAEFEEITADFGPVVERVNALFGTNFAPFVHSDENVKACFEIIERYDLADTGRSVVSEDSVSRPSDERRRRKELFRAEVNAPDLSELLEKAKGIYLDFVAP
jgi:hypothetical protein